eukprot:1140115-Pelagomonas_calceolata.AAC.1
MQQCSTLCYGWQPCTTTMHAHAGAKAESTRPLALDDLPRLKYLTACIKESMRMLPVVSIMGRSVGPKPTRIGPYLIPAGTPVAIPLFAIQNTVHNWEAPDQFMPERWLQVGACAGCMHGVCKRAGEGMAAVERKQIY